MATANPITDNTQTAENTATDLLVLVTPMAPEHFKGVLANLGSAFSAGSFVVATQNELPADIPSSVRVVATPQSNAAWSLVRALERPEVGVVPMTPLVKV